MSKVKLATVWLDGCSGCHMSFLDMDERILEIAARVEVVYSPLVDLKEFPADVDVTIVEGAVSSEEDLHKIPRSIGAHNLSLKPLFNQIWYQSRVIDVRMREHHKIDRCRIKQEFFILLRCLYGFPLKHSAIQQNALTINLK